MYKSKRHHLDILKNQLDSERSSFISHWRDISDYILPRRSRFSITEANRGEKKNQKIIDSTATLAARTLRSGMMAGITSPARPWFRLTTPDPDLAEFGAVKKWLDDVQRIMATSYLKSNLYNILPVMYGDLGVFGTAPVSIEEDFTGEVIHFKSFPVGSYMIAKGQNGRVNTFYREFRMTVAQLIEQFGKVDEKTGKPDWSKFSVHVRNLYDQGMYQSWIDVTHVIMPNKDYKRNNPFPKFKKFISYYYETGTNSGMDSTYEDRLLEEGGFDYFPILCPRWETTGEDVYGTSCPGMEALGDVKQLQHGEKRVMEAVDKMVRPPMTGPTSLKNSAASILPGDITYVDTVSGQQGFRPSHEINFRIQEMEMKQNQVRSRIQRAFYEDLFLMLANTDRRQITAREIEERHEEKLLALGPVLEQLNQDLLDPMTDIVFDIHVKQGLIPPPPQELQGIDLKVEYISIMAQAQKLLGVSAIERFTGFAGQVAGVDPSVLDKIKTDQILDVYADTISLPPSIVRTDEEVAEIRSQRARQQQMVQQAQMEAQAAATAKDLSQTDLSEDKALGAMLGLANAGI